MLLPGVGIAQHVHFCLLSGLAVCCSSDGDVFREAFFCETPTFYLRTDFSDLHRFFPLLQCRRATLLVAVRQSIR